MALESQPAPAKPKAQPDPKPPFDPSGEPPKPSPMADPKPSANPPGSAPPPPEPPAPGGSAEPERSPIDETVEGGRYLVNDVMVDADGVPIKARKASKSRKDEADDE